MPQQALLTALRGNRNLALENLALRHQLLVVQRQVKRARLSNSDRALWALLRSLWPDWDKALVNMPFIPSADGPATVLHPGWKDDAGGLDPEAICLPRLGEFATTDTYLSGHDFGTTSAIEAEGLVYAIDRTELQLQQLDPDSGDKLDSVALGGSPDYLRYVPLTREIWVNQPTLGRFEIFALGDGDPPALQADGEMAVAGGPESMVVDASGAVAYTNTFLGQTVRIDTASRTETARWSNGCSLSLGLELDEDGQRLFVGCAEGKAVALNATDGTTLSTLRASGGVDIIAYNPTPSHLYLNGSTQGELTVAGVAEDGTLTELAAVPTAPSTNSSCVAGDPHDNIWVCDANAGQLLRFTDRF